MSNLLFVQGSRVVTEHELLARPRLKVVKRPAMKRTKERQEATHSAGFMVLGYSPATWKRLPEMHATELAASVREPTKNKHPGELDGYIARWVVKNKPKRVRSKPYELESAAEECAALARKAGWQLVRVDEVMRVDTLAGKPAI